MAEPLAGLRLRSDPQQRHGQVWQWVVDVDGELPALNDVLAACYGFLVDDDCGRAVGMVEEIVVDRESAVPVGLVVAPRRGRQRFTVRVDEVLEVTPGSRRLVTACRGEHLLRSAGADQRRSAPAEAVAMVRSLAARLAGRRTGQ